MPISKGVRPSKTPTLETTVNTPLEWRSADQVVRSELATGKMFQESKVEYPDIETLKTGSGSETQLVLCLLNRSEPLHSGLGRREHKA